MIYLYIYYAKGRTVDEQSKSAVVVRLNTFMCLQVTANVLRGIGQVLKRRKNFLYNMKYGHIYR